jgi:hypothetical protein
VALATTLTPAQRAAPLRHEALRSGLVALCRDQLQRLRLPDVEASLGLLALDIELNAQGLGIWLDRGMP